MSESESKRGGKHIKATTKIVDGHLCMCLARAKSKAVCTELYWDIRGKLDDPFIMVMSFPALDGLSGSEDTVVSMPMNATQGQTAYATHPRKVAPSDIDHDCPVFDVLSLLDPDGNIPVDPSKPRPGRKPGSGKKADAAAS